MKISSDTLAILKNFSSINSGIMIKKGNVISTIAPTDNILATAVIEESFPREFCIYSLNNFLSVLSLFKDGFDLEFDDKHVYIRGYNNRSKVSYRYTKDNMIKPSPYKTPEFPSIDVSFTLTEQDFGWITKCSNVLESPYISINTDGDDVFVTNFDLNDDSANKNSLLLPDVKGNGNKYKLIFKTEFLKLMPRTYNVGIYSGGIAKFSDEQDKLVYYIALETASTYE